MLKWIFEVQSVLQFCSTSLSTRLTKNDQAFVDPLSRSNFMKWN